MRWRKQDFSIEGIRSSEVPQDLIRGPPGPRIPQDLPVVMLMTL